MKQISVLIAVLVLFSCAGTDYIPKTRDVDDTLLVFKCTAKKEINYEYGFDYRLYIEESSGREHHFNIYPTRREFVVVRSLPPGEYTITKFVTFYKTGGTAGPQYPININVSLKPRMITVSPIGIDVILKRSDDKRYLYIQYSSFSNLLVSDFEKVVEKLKTDEDTAGWDFVDFVPVFAE